MPATHRRARGVSPSGSAGSYRAFEPSSARRKLTLRWSPLPPRSANGGNCYACHQLAKQEVSFGTLGPPLVAYGKIRGFGAADTKTAYEKIYNSNAGLACSNMPRFGSNKILTIEQIKDAVALLMSPDSPVNK